MHYLDTDLAQAGGYTVTVGAVLLKLIDWLGHYEIHDYFQGAMAAGGFVFLCFKISNIRIDRRIKKLDEKLKQKELEQDQDKICH